LSCTWWRAYRDGKSGGRAGSTWRAAKVDQGKESRSVGRAVNEVLEKVQVILTTLLSASVERLNSWRTGE